jgi:ferredoxin, 2Fe-2S
MAKIIYVRKDGSRNEVEVPIGWSVMEGAIRNGVDGIVAECGGACQCATCHVMVDTFWAERISAAGSTEKVMMELLDEITPTSRLSCQIVVSEELDGLIVNIPEEQ